MGDIEFRKTMLGGKKTERIIFAATPELKKAIEEAAAEQCISASAYISQAVVSKLSERPDNGEA